MPDGATLDNTADCVQWVRLLAAHDAALTGEGVSSYRVTLRVGVDSPTRTGYDILSSPKVPQPSELYYGWTLSPDNFSYSRNQAVADPSVSLAHAAPRRLLPTVWDIELAYEAAGSILFDIPEVQYGRVTYQTAALTDSNGKPYLNSAGDPIDGGALIDGHRRTVTITRHVPWNLWNPELVDEFEKSLNLYPFRHGTLTKLVYPPDGDPAPPTAVPVDSPPGSCKLQSIDADRVLLRRGKTVATSLFAARTTAVIEIDRRTFADNDGTRKPVLWRDVKIDAGYNELVQFGADKFTKRRVTAGAFGQGGPALLDGKGAKLKPDAPPPGSPPPPPPPTGTPPPPPAFTPKVRVFDPYPTKDWGALAFFIAGW